VHETTIREFSIGSNGISIGPPIENSMAFCGACRNTSVPALPSTEPNKCARWTPILNVHLFLRPTVAMQSLLLAF
jgi:hypothetical protein